MSCFVCPHCNEPSFIFGKEGARRTAAKKGLKLIGEVNNLGQNRFDSLCSRTLNTILVVYIDSTGNVDQRRF